MVIVTLGAVTMLLIEKAMDANHAISVSALWMKESIMNKEFKCKTAESIPRLTPGIMKKTFRELNTNANRWFESHLGNKAQQTVTDMRFITQFSEDTDSCSRADSQKESKEVSFSLKCPCIPLVLINTSILEHLSIRGSMVWRPLPLEPPSPGYSSWWWGLFVLCRGTKKYRAICNATATTELFNNR